MSFGNLYKNVVDKLSLASIPNSFYEADLIFCHFLNIDNSQLKNMLILDDFSKLDISDDELTAVKANINNAINRRINREPLQHILGITTFYGLDLKVGSGVFIPRNETEILVERALLEVLQMIGNTKKDGILQKLNVLDLCAGSGAIGLAFAKEFKHKYPQINLAVTFVEQSKDAVQYLSINVNSFLEEFTTECLPADDKNGNMKTLELKVEHQEAITFLTQTKQKFDVILTNPPYVPTKYQEQNMLQPEVKYDPDEALFSGVEGLDLPLEIVENSHKVLENGGLILMEHFDTQSPQIRRELKINGFQNVKSFSDLNSIERFTMGVYNSKQEGTS